MTQGGLSGIIPSFPQDASFAEVAELVDAQVSKTCKGNLVPVRFRLSAPFQRS